MIRPPALISAVAAVLLLSFANAGCGPQLHPVVAKEVANATQATRSDTAINSVEKLGRYGSAGLEGLIVLLDGKNVSVRLATVLEMGRILRGLQFSHPKAPSDPLQAPIPPELKSAQEADEKRTEKEKRRQIDRITGALIRTLQYDDAWTVRRVVAAIFSNIPGGEIDRALIESLADGNAAVRQQAGISLTKRSAEIDPLLIQTAESGKTEQVKFALALLGKRGVKTAIPVAVKLAADPNWEVRSQAMLILGQLKADSDEVQLVLIEHLNDPEPRAAMYAARALIAIGREDGAREAVKRFPDSDLVRDFEKVEKKEPTEDPSLYQGNPDPGGLDGRGE